MTATRRPVRRPGRRPASRAEATRVAGTTWPTSRLRPHAHAGLLPEPSNDNNREFHDDIRERGVTTQLEITPAGTVLNGTRRLRAATELGIPDLPVRIVRTSDEFDYVIRAALHQRHLTQSQRAALALELHDYHQLKHAKATPARRDEVATLPPGKTRDIAATWADVSARTIQDAATVHQHDQALFQEIKNGRVGAALAARRVRRQLRDASINPAPPIPEGPYQLIYADPPWQLGNPDSQYAPENHYPTMPLDQIAALNVPAADDAILFLWAVTSLLPEALHVIDAWGFTYKTQLVWVKPSIGPGNWVRNQHELLLLATRGKPPLAEPDQRPGSVIHADRGRHSEKPVQAYELIETGWPQLSKLELFARNNRAGWASWGNQLPA